MADPVVLLSDLGVLGGERLFVQRGQVFILGVSLEHPFTTETQRTQRKPIGSTTRAPRHEASECPRGQVFILGVGPEPPLTAENAERAEKAYRIYHKATKTRRVRRKTAGFCSGTEES